MEYLVSVMRGYWTSKFAGVSKAPIFFGSKMKLASEWVGKLSMTSEVNACLNAKHRPWKLHSFCNKSMNIDFKPRGHIKYIIIAYSVYRQWLDRLLTQRMFV